MKFSTASALTVAALASSTLAAPTAPIKPRSYDNSTYTYSPQYPLATIHPIILSQYTVSTGAVNFATQTGLVSKSPNNHGADITTLVTFIVDQAYSGYTCRLGFDLAPTDVSSGSGQVDLFMSLAPAAGLSTTWPSGNQRDNFLGRIQTQVGTDGTFIQAIDGVDQGFPCSSIAGNYYGGEVVGVNDVDYVSWASINNGPKIIVY